MNGFALFFLAKILWPPTLGGWRRGGGGTTDYVNNDYNWVTTVEVSHCAIYSKNKNITTF